MTTGRRPGRTIAAVSTRWESFAARWMWPAVAALAVGVIGVFGSIGGDHRLGIRRPDALGVALLAAAASGVLFARRWPEAALALSLGCTVLYFAAGYPTDSPFFLPLAVTAYQSGAAGARARAGVFAAAVLASFAALALLGPPVSRGGAPAFAVIVLLSLIAGQAAAEWRARAERRTGEAHEEEARRRVAEERIRIARDVHDVVSHSIATINVQAGVALHVMEEQPQQAREALVAIRVASRDALRDLRGILGLLRDADGAEPRAPAGGLEQLGDLVDSIRRAGVTVSVEADVGGGHVPAAVDVAAYRVVQEALTNVLRHAPGAAARVSVRRAPAELQVEVEDDGAAPPAQARQGAGQGLLGMRERVRAAGGTLDAGPRDGSGFAVRARLPLPEEPA
jgi:signal transduction histidine kinase